MDRRRNDAKRTRSVLFAWLSATILAIAASCSGVDESDNPALGNRKPNEPTGAAPPGTSDGTEPPPGGDPDGNGGPSSPQGDAGVPQGDAGFVGDTGVASDANLFGGNSGTGITPTGAGGSGGF